MVGDFCRREVSVGRRELGRERGGLKPKCGMSCTKRFRYCRHERGACTLVLLTQYVGGARGRETLREDGIMAALAKVVFLEQAGRARARAVRYREMTAAINAPDMVEQLLVLARELDDTAGQLEKSATALCRRRSRHWPWRRCLSVVGRAGEKAIIEEGEEAVRRLKKTLGDQES
jgi:hypothetical protein